MCVTDLPLPASGVIRHICHLSDIHIRPGIDTKDEKSSRFSEYMGVFRRIARFLEKRNAQKDLVICITGDLLHDNRKAGAPCIELFYEIIDILSAVAPVYIIRGNHDYNQASLDTQDLITALMYGLRARPNVAYLDRTGQYNAANVCFGVVAIQDAVKAGNTNGSVCYENLPAFPRLVKAEDKTRIALFHGDVFRPPTTLDWILSDEGYDFVMLGDLHHQHVSGKSDRKDASQTLDVEMDENDVAEIAAYAAAPREPATLALWAYAGSPIQQNFGEPLFGHGFLMWDVPQKTVRAYHVRNDFAYLTAYIDHAHQREIMFPVTLAKNPQQVVCVPHTLAQLEKRAWMPRRIRLKIKKHPARHTLQDTLDIHRQLHAHGFTLESSQEILHLADDRGSSRREANTQLLDIDLHAYNQPSAWAEFVRQNADASRALTYDKWEEWFHHPESLFIQENAVEEGVLHANVRQDIKEKNKKIAQALQTFRATYDHIAASHTSHTRFDILYMNWSYILCFDADCHFDFQALDGNIHCIGAKNGFGKTSFFETILIALFGEGFPSRNAKHMSSSIISVRQNRGWTSIVVKLDNTVYRIKRLFTKVPKDAQKIQAKDVSLEVWEDDNHTFREIQSGKKATTEWIHKHIGTLDMFLTSCMVSQTSENEFFAKKAPEQKAYLDEQLKLHASSAFMALLKTAKLAYSDIAKRVADIIEITQHDVKTPQLQTQHRDTMQSLQDIRETMDRLRDTQKRLQPLVLPLTDTSLIDLPPEAISEKKSRLDRHIQSVKTRVPDAVDDVPNELTREHYRPDVSLQDIEAEIRDHEKRKPTQPKPLDHAASVEQNIHKLRALLRERNSSQMRDRWDEYQRRARDLEHAHARRTADLERREKEARDARERHTRCQAQLSQHLAAQPPPPAYTQAQYDQWCRDIRRFESENANIGHHHNIAELGHEKAHLIIQEYPGDVARLSSIRQQKANVKNLLAQCGEYKYNPNCEACRNHPWNVQRTGFMQQLSDLEHQEGRLGHHIAAKYGDAYAATEDTSSAHSLIEDAKAWVRKQTWAELRCQEEAQMSAKRQREACADWSARVKDLNTKVTNGLAACTETTHAAREGAHELQKITASLQDVRASLHALGIDIEMCASCENELAENEKKRGDIGEHDRWQTTTEHLWKRRHAHEAHDRMTAWQELRERQDEMEKMSVYLERYQDYHTYHKNLRAWEDLQEKKVETLSRISVLEREWEVAAERETKLRKRVAYHGDISRESKTATHVLDIFSSFKDWLMREKIIPTLLEQVNIILADLCQQHRPLQLRCEIEDASGNFMWSLADQQNVIPLEKASGFQKATVNLVMRIVLGKLGVSGIKNAQLFIDEGFTACDRANLDIVPVVLENLLHKYASILLVTHLENLKANIPSSIDIARNEHTGYSKIQHGSTLPQFDVSRKRGRTKNIKNVV